jgi:hypothetical protein
MNLDGLDNLDKNELVIITIENITKIKKWKSLFSKTGNWEGILSVTDKKIVTGDHLIDNLAFNTIEIICSVENFIKLIPQLRKLDEDDMLTVQKTYQELEKIYHDYQEE